MLNFRCCRVSVSVIHTKQWSWGESVDDKQTWTSTCGDKRWSCRPLIDPQLLHTLYQAETIKIDSQTLSSGSHHVIFCFFLLQLSASLNVQNKAVVLLENVTRIHFGLIHHKWFLKSLEFYLILTTNNCDLLLQSGQMVFFFLSRKTSLRLYCRLGMTSNHLAKTDLTVQRRLIPPKVLSMFVWRARATLMQLGWVEINEVKNANPAPKSTELPLTRVLCFWRRIIVLFYPAQTRQHNCSFLKTVIQRAFCGNPTHFLVRCRWSICLLVVFPMPMVLL